MKKPRTYRKYRLSPKLGKIKVERPQPGEILEKRHAFTPEDVAKAIGDCRGLISEVAIALGLTQRAINKYIAERTICSQALKDARAKMGDKAEGKLFDHIEAGDRKCLMYYLSTVHADRGYGLKNGGNPFGGGPPVFVESVNIVAIPNGKFLTKEEADHFSRDPLLVEYSHGEEEHQDAAGPQQDPDQFGQDPAHDSAEEDYRQAG